MGKKFPLFLIRRRIIIQSNIIYNFEDLRALLINKIKNGSYYLLFNDTLFKKIKKCTVINREVYTIAKKIRLPLEEIKYATFNTKKAYTKKKIYQLIQTLQNVNKIIVTIINLKRKEVFILFISNKNQSLVEQYIDNFFEKENK